MNQLSIRLRLIDNDGIIDIVDCLGTWTGHGVNLMDLLHLKFTGFLLLIKMVLNM